MELHCLHCSQPFLLLHIISHCTCCRKGMQSSLRESVIWALRSACAEMSCDFPGITESLSLCRGCLEFGSTDFRCCGFFHFLLRTDTEHLKVPVAETLYSRVAQMLSNTHLQKKLNEEKLIDRLRK